MQSVLITTKVVSSNAAHDEVYSMQHYVIKFVSDLRQVSGFLQVIVNNVKTYYDWFGWFMVFYDILKNISAISWWLVLLVEETRVPGGNH
jgi:hypothetical protein